MFWGLSSAFLIVASMKALNALFWYNLKAGPPLLAALRLRYGESSDFDSSKGSLNVTFCFAVRFLSRLLGGACCLGPAF